MAPDPNAQADRRKGSLSDHDVERIGQAFDRKMQSMCEVIGYDISTPEARAEIRKDHEFVRSARQAKATIIGSILASVGSGIAFLVYSLTGKH